MTQSNMTIHHSRGSGKRRRGLLRWLAVAACGWLTLACATEQPAVAPEQSTAAPKQNAAPPAAAQAPDPSAPDDTQYIIGPGDVIQVFVWRNPELSVTVPVRPDGKISTPLVEDLTAVGKTPSMLARDIETSLAEYVRSPQVNVIINTPANAFNQVKVIGQVKTPQSLPYRSGMTALDAILGAGGLTEFAAGNRTVLVRKGADGKEERIKVRLNDVLTKGKLSSNVLLKAGDVVIVPESLF